MSFEFSRDYLILAEALLADSPGGPGHEEARVRSAVSRAYYAAFHGAQRYLIDLQREIAPSLAPNLRSDRSHERVWDRYKTAGRALARISIYGFRLKDLRRRADYDAQNVSLEHARQTIDGARKLLHILATLSESDVQALGRQLSREPF